MILNVLKNSDFLFEINLSEFVSDLTDTQSKFMLGRASSCYVMLDDMQVSREHAEITFSNGRWLLKVLSKLSFLTVNGLNITEVELNNGDIIAVGPFSINVVYNDQDKSYMTDDNRPVSGSTEHFDNNTIAINDENYRPFDDLNDSLSTATNGQASEQTEQSSGSDKSGIIEKGPENFSDESEHESEVGDEYQEHESEYAEEEMGEVSEYDSDEYSESDDDEYENGEKTEVISGFAKFALQLFGEYAPYDRYIIVDNRTVIGRIGEECQIQLDDEEVSKKHAVLVKQGGGFVLEDLKSSNGTLLNGKRVNSSEVIPGDEFIIGSTTFTLSVESELISSEKKNLMPVEDNQFVEIEEVIEVDTNFDDFEENEVEEKSLLKRIWKDDQKRKRLIFGLVGLAAAYTFLVPDEAPEVNKTKTKANKVLVTARKDQEKLKKFSKEELEFLNANYQLALTFYEKGKYQDALHQIEKVMSLDTDYKIAKQIQQFSLEALAKLEELEKKKQAEIERKIREEKVAKLVVKATSATKERKEDLAESLFSQIIELDPENFDVPPLKMELLSWKKEQDRLALIKAEKEADRKRKVAKLDPARRAYVKKKWHQAILKLDTFLKIKDMDEDLVEKATSMLNESKQSLDNIISPMLGKARSLKEGQDLKGAYEKYLEILKYDPTKDTALNNMNEIREILKRRSMKIYRSGLISESLSLFNDAKEKFQETQQISPSDSEYYLKASNKLKDYLD